MPDDELTAADAVRALRERGVDNPEPLLQYGTPAQIIGACRRWDRLQGVGKGLLVKRIREANFAEEPAVPQSRGAILRARFEEYARRFPEGAAVMTHATLDAMLRPGNADDCAGRMVVYSIGYPVLALECEACGFEQGIPVRGLHILGSPVRAVPDPEPDIPF